MIKLVWYAWLVLVAAAVGPAIIVGWAAYSFGAETKPPAPVKGWLLLRVCTLSGKTLKDYPEWIFVNPNAIIGVGNPPTSPKECVAVTLNNTSRMYVYGTDTGIAEAINKETLRCAQ
jgi:hypothetical protein